MKRSFLKIQPAVRAPSERMNRVVAVLCAEAVKNDFARVRHVVTIRVLRENDVRLLRDIRPAVAQFEPRRHVQFVRKHRVRVRPPVAVRVLENDQLVVRVLVRQPLWIRRHRGHPKPALRIERDRHGLLDRKIDLRCEKIYFVTARHVEPLERNRRVLRGKIEHAAPVRFVPRYVLSKRHRAQLRENYRREQQPESVKT